MSELTRALNDSITVEELIDMLKAEDPKAKVLFSYNTEVASSIQAIEERELTYSNNCRSLAVLDEDHEYDEFDGPIGQAVVIS